MIRKRTKDEFNEPCFLTRFVTARRLLLALERPDLIKLATPLLQHQAETSRDLHVLADKIVVSRKFGDTPEPAPLPARKGGSIGCPGLQLIRPHGVVD